MESSAEPASPQATQSALPPELQSQSIRPADIAPQATVSKPLTESRVAQFGRVFDRDDESLDPVTIKSLTLPALLETYKEIRALPVTLRLALWSLAWIARSMPNNSLLKMCLDCYASCGGPATAQLVICLSATNTDRAGFLDHCWDRCRAMWLADRQIGQPPGHDFIHARPELYTEGDAAVLALLNSGCIPCPEKKRDSK
jgi:hypothetical protein